MLLLHWRKLVSQTPHRRTQCQWMTKTQQFEWFLIAVWDSIQSDSFFGRCWKWFSTLEFLFCHCRRKIAENSIVKFYEVNLQTHCFFIKIPNPHGQLIFSSYYLMNILNHSIVLLNNHVMHFFIVRKKIKYLLVLLKQCITNQIQWLLCVNISAKEVHRNFDFYLHIL